MRAAAAPFRGPEGRLKQACPRPEHQQEEPAGCRRRIGGPGLPLGSRRTRRRSTTGRPPAPARAHARTGSSAGTDAGGALVRSRDHGARRMRAAAAPFRGPKGRLKQACPRSERQQEEPALSRARQDAKRRETQDAGVGLARPNVLVGAAGRGVGAQPAVQGRPHAHTPILKAPPARTPAERSSADSTREPAGCGRPLHHSAARRAA